MENEVFEEFGFFFNFHVVKGREVSRKAVNSEVGLQVSQLFCVDEFEGLSPNVVKRSILCFVFFIFIVETKNPHFSEINEVRVKVRIFLLHFHIFGVVVEGKTDLADDSRLLILGCIDNEVLLGWSLFDFIALTFLIDDEVGVWLNFPDRINLIVDFVYFFVGPHFSELAFGIVPEVEV